MQSLKLLLFVICSAFVIPAFSQTDTAVVKVDTAFRNPGTPLTPKDTTDSARILTPLIKKADTVAVAPKKAEVVKDSARLALESMTRKAVLRSAILPGLGQIYNGRWWKVPLVYGGFVGIGLVYEFNQRYYKEFLGEAQYRQATGEPKNPKYAPYSDEGIINAKDFYRRNRDLSILAGVAFYAVQMIDAYVDAKFFRFDVSDELALKIEPSLQPAPFSYAYTVYPGFKLKLSL